MYAKPLVLASAVAMAASVAAVQPERPRIYFPREVKREYHNSTVTSHESPATPDVTTTTTTSSSTRRDLLSDLISEILGSVQPQQSSTTEQPPVTTVVVDTTVSLSGPSSGSGFPEQTVLPTSKINESRTTTSTHARSSTEPGIVIGPTGIVSSTSEPKTTDESPKIASVDPPVTSNTLPETKFTTPATVNLSPQVSSVDTSVNNTVPETKPSTPITVNVPTATGEPTTKLSSVDPPIGNSTAPEATPTPTTTPGGILDPIGTLLSSLLPAPPSTNTKMESSTQTGTSKPSESTDSSEQPVSQNSTTQAAQTTETATGLLPPLSSLLPIPGTTTTTSNSGSLPNATSTEVPVSTQFPSTKVSSKISVTSTKSPASTATNAPSSTTTDIPIGNSTSATTGTVSSTLTGTDIPVTNGTVSAPPTSTATSQPTKSISVPNDNSTMIVGPTTTSNPGTGIPTTKSDAATTIVPTTTSDIEVTSIRPTATLPSTDNWLPTTVIIEPTTFTFSTPTANPTETSSQGLPTTIPKVIKPGDGEVVPVPEGTVPIHIGFQFALHYLFVASNSTAASQIFDYLPRVLSDASGIDVKKLAVTELVPYNTLATKGWVTTIARLNYPKNLLQALEVNLKTPSSPIYQNRQPILSQFALYIDPSISPTGDLNDGSSTSNGGSNSGNNGSNNNNNNNNNNDAFGSGNQGDQTSKQKATTAGIAVAAVGLSALYGAAMFIVARRYKRKRQGHRRASSMTSGQGTPEMRYNGNASPALMGGALLSRDGSTYGGTGGRDSHASGGHSARTANISAPVATENSLGWN